MKTKIVFLLLIALYAKQSICAEYSSEAIHSSNKTNMNQSKSECEDSPYECYYCLDPLSGESKVAVFSCDKAERHFLCNNCHPENTPIECPMCRLKIEVKLKPLSETKSYIAPIVTPVEEASIEESNNAASKNVQGQNESDVTESFSRKKLFKTVFGEACAALLVGITTRLLYDKGALNHETAAERNASWSAVGGLIVTSNRLLQEVNPQRQQNKSAMAATWLIAGAVGASIPSLFNKNNK